MCMDKKIFRSFAISLLMLLIPGLFFAAEVKTGLTEEEADYANLVTGINTVQEPYIKNGYVVFTADKSARFVGIAFDFENYKTIHHYQKHNIYTDSGEVKSSLYFYALKLTKDMQKIKYRVVIDGLWTLDPTNESRIFDRSTGLLLSVYDATRDIPPATEQLKSGIVRFVYQGEEGKQVRLGGSFTNWDSWIYEMKEVKPGLYQFELSLPPGTYQYAYFSGMNTIVDTTNPERCYTIDGKTASQITVR